MNTPHATGKMWELFNGDCLHIMRGMAAESIDSIVTDPPYGLSFMGKDWDRGVPGSPFWVEALRVAKPGAHLLAFGGTRMFHRLACAIEDAGWEIRDCVMWVHGMGFPKSHNIGKAIDKMDATDEQRKRRLRFTSWVRSQNVTAKQIDDATKTQMGGHYTANESQPAIMTREHLEACRHLFNDVPEWVERECDIRSVESKNTKQRKVVGKYVSDMGGLGGQRLGRSKGDITTAFTNDAARWEGWGTALKPAWEPVLVCRKPIAAGMTVAGNVVEHGCGALNIDGCRIGNEQTTTIRNGNSGKNGIYQKDNRTFARINPPGRWPANVVHDGSEEVVRLMPDEGNGSAARFFYCAKADATDRDDGCESLPLRDAGSRTGDLDGSLRAEPLQRRNNHPTVKPNDLMRWLCRLVTPPGGTVLDPFMGSGSTGKAAIAEGFRFVGIDLSTGFCDIAAARIGSAHNLFNA